MTGEADRAASLPPMVEMGSVPRDAYSQFKVRLWGMTDFLCLRKEPRRERFVAFSDRGQSLNKAHIQYLEHRMIQTAADLSPLSAFLQESRVYLIPPKNTAGFRPALRKTGQDRRISVSKI
jgi:hypothetical protein